MPLGNLSKMVTLRACDELVEILKKATEDLSSAQTAFFNKRNEHIKSREAELSELSKEAKIQTINEEIEKLFAGEAKELDAKGEEEVEIEVPENAKSFARDNWETIVKLFPRGTSRKNLLNIGEVLGVE